MRRLWIVVAGIVTVFGMTAAPQVAYARDNAAHSATSCTDLIKKYQNTQKATGTINFSNPKSLSKVFKQVAKVLRQLGSNGPNALKASFKRLAKAYDKLAKVDFSNPSSLQQLQTFGTALQSDLLKIAQYFAKNCGFSIPTT